MHERHTPLPETTAYRDPSEGLAFRRRELLAKRERQWRQLAPALVKVYVRRFRRIAFGAAASVGGLVAFALGLGAFVSGNLWQPSGSTLSGLLTCAVLGSWVLGMAAWVTSGRVARGRLLRAVRRAWTPTGDVYADIARLEAGSAVDLARAWIARLAAPSVAWPLSAIALLAPLTLHFAVFLLVSGGSELGAFDAWIGASAVLVIHCHLYVVYRAWVFAYRGGRTASAEASRTLGRVTALSAIPGVLLLLIPTALVAVTGLFILGPAFRGIDRLTTSERIETEIPVEA